MFGDVIRQLREDQGWSQAELAKRSEVAQSQIAGLETGKTANPTSKTLKRLASAFGMSDLDLLALIDSPDPVRAGQELKLSKFISSLGLDSKEDQELRDIAEAIVARRILRQNNARVDGREPDQATETEPKLQPLPDKRELPLDADDVPNRRARA